MIKTFPELPGWYFDLDEISANVYQVIATDKSGHTVSATGTDLDGLIEQCRKGALEIVNSGKASSGTPTDNH
jgi:hypothetical protein